MVVVRFSTGTRCTGLGLLQALTEANVANIEILNRACLRWSSTTWSTNLSAISEGFPRQKAARHAAATTAGCNGIMTRTRTEATRTHSLMSPMLVTSDETGLESVGGEIVSGRADGSKGVRRRSTEDDCLAHGDWLPGEQHSNQLNPYTWVMTHEVRDYNPTSVCHLLALAIKSSTFRPVRSAFNRPTQFV